MIEVLISYVEELEEEARAKRKAIEELKTKLNRLDCLIDFAGAFLKEVNSHG